MGKMIELTASDGHKLAAYRAEPSGKPRGAIVVIQEIFGVNSHIKQVADGYAADGYLAIAPALFDRVQKNVELGYTPDDIAKGREIRAKVTNDMAVKDAEAAVKAAAGTGKVGIVGYCWGGFVTWLAANKISGLSAAVPYYGGGILDNTGIAPKVPLMGHFGDKDQHIPVDGVKKLAEKYPQHQIFIYHRREHHIAVVLQVTGFSEQALLDHMSRPDMLVAVARLRLAHVALHQVAQHLALGREQRQPWPNVVGEVEQAQLFSQFAMVAPARLLKPAQVLFQLGLAVPGRAVDPLEHRAMLIAAPVRAGHAQQLEAIGGNIACVRHMRSAAQIFERVVLKR